MRTINQPNSLFPRQHIVSIDVSDEFVTRASLIGDKRFSYFLLFGECFSFVVLQNFGRHEVWSRDNNGRLRIFPAQSIKKLRQSFLENLGCRIAPII